MRSYGRIEPVDFVDPHELYHFLTEENEGPSNGEWVTKTPKQMIFEDPGYYFTFEEGVALITRMLTGFPFSAPDYPQGMAFQALQHFLEMYERMQTPLEKAIVNIKAAMQEQVTTRLEA